MLTLGQEYTIVTTDDGYGMMRRITWSKLGGRFARRWAADLMRHAAERGETTTLKVVAYRRGWRIGEPWARRFKAGDLVRRRSLGSVDPKVFEIFEADPGETFVSMHPTAPNYYDPESGSWFGLCIAGTCDLVLATDAMKKRDREQRAEDAQRLAALAEARDSEQYKIDIDRLLALLPVAVPKALAAELTERVFIMLEDPDPTDEYDPAGMLETAAEDLISVISSEWNHLGDTPAELRKEQAKAGRWRKVCREIVAELNNPEIKRAAKAIDSIVDVPDPDTRTEVEIVKVGFMMAVIWRDGRKWGAQLNGITRADFETRQQRDQWVKDQTGARNV